MDISARADYAVRAMLTIAARAESGAGEPVSVERLAAEQDLPRKFLEAIVSDLRRAGLLESRRGAGGGYVLTRAPGQIFVGDILRAVDGPLAEVRGQRPQSMSYTGVAAHLPQVWVAVRASVRAVLDTTSLEHVLTGRLPAEARRALRAPDAWDNR